MSVTSNTQDAAASAAGARSTASTQTPHKQPTSVTLSWMPPTDNTDGSVLKDLAGYRIYTGSSPEDLQLRTTLKNPGLTRFVVEPLAPGEIYFAIAAVNAAGKPGDRSGVVALD